jgi:hypothetical protein
VLAGWDAVVRGAVAVADSTKPSAAPAPSVVVGWNRPRLTRFRVRPQTRPQTRPHGREIRGELARAR